MLIRGHIPYLILKYGMCPPIIIFLLASNVAAGMPPQIDAAIYSAYPPAVAHEALETAFSQPDMEKLRGFVVVEQGGIPVERARFFIEWGEYDYRGAVIHLDKGGDITTRRGIPYAYLQRGDILVVAGIKDFHRTIYLKLLSVDPYVPEHRQGEKRHARVTVMLGFEFPKEVFAKDDAPAVLKAMAEWLRPFQNLDEAKKYTALLKNKEDISHSQKRNVPFVSGEAGKKGDSEKLKSLEEKIEAARRQIEEAERELKRLKR